MSFLPIILFSLLGFCWCNPPGEVQFVVNMVSQLECCDEASEAHVNTSEVIVGRYNETVAYMSGNIIFLIGVHRASLELILHKEANGKYELMYSHEICDLCDEIAKGEDSDYVSYIKFFGLPDECPFEAGKYPILELMVDTNDFPVNSNTVGRYRALVNLYKPLSEDCKSEKVFLFCLSLKLIIEAA